MNRDFLLFIIGLALILSMAYVFAENNGPRYLGPCSGYVNTGVVPGGVAGTSDSGASVGSGGCGNCGGCGNSVSGEVTETDKLESVKGIASNYYRDTYGDDDFRVEVTDYGCHMQADIIKDGVIVKSLSIYGTKIYESG